MRTLHTAGVVFACLAVVAGLLLCSSYAAPGVASAPAAAQAALPNPLVVHEWGTFTSFSGSDGEPVGFRPNNNDLPDFVYYQGDDDSKANRLAKDGTVSMETPILYFYTDKKVEASIRVDFPKGWITEWYPYAAAPPAHTGRQPRAMGQSLRWDVKLLPGESVHFPREKNDSRYYQARETDAAPVQAEVKGDENDESQYLRGGTVIQREKFLFYRGVGAFAPPVAVLALGDGKVRIRNTINERIGGLVLVTVHGGKVGFKTLTDLSAGTETTTSLPEADATSADLSEVMVKKLLASGLFEKEARAMVKTWDSAWFGEEGARLLYFVPRPRTDELLPLTIEPKPTEVIRVLVGRHDFLTPEQETVAERQVRRAQAAEEELVAAEKELRSIGRFTDQARQMAAKRLEARTSQR